MRRNWKTIRIGFCLAAMLGLLLAGLCGAALFSQKNRLEVAQAFDLADSGTILSSGFKMAVPPLGNRWVASGVPQNPIARLRRDYEGDSVFSFYVGMGR